MNNAQQIAATLTAAGVAARVLQDRFGDVTVEACDDVAARDALGMDRFRDYVNGHEVVII